jgi:hypothetical protein
MRELPRFPGKLRVAKALLGNLEGPGTEEALCPPSQVECHLVKTIRAGVRARAHTQICAQSRSSHIGWKSFWKTCPAILLLSRHQNERCAFKGTTEMPFWRVLFSLASFDSITSLSSERNAVNKSSALMMNRFPSRCASTQKRSPCFVRCSAMP